MRPSEFLLQVFDPLLRFSGLLGFLVSRARVIESTLQVWKNFGLGLQNALRLRDVLQTGRVLFAQLTQLSPAQEKLGDDLVL